MLWDGIPMSNKLSVINIIKDHISTLKDYDNGRYSILDLFIFFILPIFVSSIIIYFKVILSDQLVNVLVMSLSVFAGLLFNLLLLVYDIIGKPNSNKRPLRATLLKELSSNISFGILISVVTIILLLVFSLATTSDVLTNHNVISNNINISSNNTNEAYDFALLDAQTMPYLLAFLIYYLVSIFILNLFMILKRFHIILRSEFKRDTS
ncbi:MAG: hypothetical protein KBA97_02840 [Methanothrix sp.]|nr:hypothetical protein [Methanothrix sp.]